MNQFWMVQGEGLARVRHQSQSAAEAEAQRLARQCPGVEFYVMEAIACHRKVDVERIALRHDDEDDIPF